MLNLTKSLADGIRENGQDRKGEFHVSDLRIAQSIPLCDRSCPRSFWFRYKGYEGEETGPGKQMMFNQGHALEKRAIKGLKRGLPDKARIIGTQIDVTPGLPYTFSGRLDALVYYQNKYMVVDFKTRRGGAFRYNSEVKPGDKYQVGGYLEALNNMFLGEIDHGAILELDREGQNFTREHHFQFDPDFRDNIRKAFNEVFEISQQEDPPERMDPVIEENQNKGPNSVKLDLPWQCSYCKYRGVACQGAVPPKFDDKLDRVVGHIKDGKFVEKYEGISEYVNILD